MKMVIFILLAIQSLITGVVAAMYWYKASAVSPRPDWEKPGGAEPGDFHLIPTLMLRIILRPARSSAELNAKAAAWTAITVVLTTMLTLVGALP
jgi:hypothetical protein